MFCFNINTKSSLTIKIPLSYSNSLRQNPELIVKEFRTGNNLAIQTPKKPVKEPETKKKEVRNG